MDGSCLAVRGRGHLCTTLYISVVFLFRNYTGWYKNDGTALASQLCRSWVHGVLLEIRVERRPGVHAVDDGGGEVQ